MAQCTASIARPGFLPLRALNHNASCLRQLYSSRSTIQENDVVLLQETRRRSAKPMLTPPLKLAESIPVQNATIAGSAIIGKEPRQLVTDSRGTVFRVNEPSLAAYTLLTPRLVTPIYPADTNTIVSLLDINVPRPGEDPVADAAPPFEIFEAGTGHGALTLHLARAIHSGNPAVPAPLRAALAGADYVVPKQRSRFSSAPASPEPDNALTTSTPENPEPHPLRLPDFETAAAYQAYLASRRAVVQTLDINAGHSRLAHANVRGFRRAMYLPNVSFHVGRVPSYLRARLAASPPSPSAPTTSTDNQTSEDGSPASSTITTTGLPTPFLSHAILDLPSPFDPHTLALIAASLRPNGLLLVFCPSVTQLAEGALLLNSSTSTTDTPQGRKRRTREALLPFRQERVVQLPRGTLDMHSDALEGGSMGGGGEDWAFETEEVVIGEEEDADSQGLEAGAGAGATKTKTLTKCRPLVGVMHLTGGGFVGVYRKLIPNAKQQAYVDELVRQGEAREKEKEAAAAAARLAQDGEDGSRRRGDGARPSMSKAWLANL